MKAKKLWCILAPLILVFIIAMIFVLVYILNKDKIDDIQVDSTNVETTIDWGEELDLSGLVVKVKYKSGKLKTLNSSDYQVDLGEFDNETAGNYKILIQYGRFKKELTITVAQPKVTQIILNTEQVQKTFAWGEKFNHNNIKVQAVLEDGTVENVKEGDYKILNSSYDAYFPGEYKIRVYVENLSVFYTVTVQDLPSDQVQKVLTPKKMTLMAGNGDKIQISPIEGKTDYQFAYNKEANFTLDVETEEGVQIVWASGENGATLYNNNRISFDFKIVYNTYSQEYSVDLMDCHSNYNILDEIELNRNNYNINFGKDREDIILYTDQDSITGRFDKNLKIGDFNLKINGVIAVINKETYYNTFSLPVDEQNGTTLELIYNGNTYYTIHLIFKREAKISSISYQDNYSHSISFAEVSDGQYYSKIDRLFNINNLIISTNSNYTYKIADPEPFKLGDNTFYINIYDQSDTEQEKPIKTVTVNFNLCLVTDGGLSGFLGRYFDITAQKIICYTFAEENQLEYADRLFNESGISYTLQPGLNECYVKFNYKNSNFEGKGTDFLIPATLYNGLPVEKVSIDGKDYSLKEFNSSIYVYGDYAEKQFTVEFDDDIFEVYFYQFNDYCKLQSSTPMSIDILKTEYNKYLYVFLKGMKIDDIVNNSIQHNEINFQKAYVKVSYQLGDNEYVALPNSYNQINLTNLDLTLSNFNVEVDEGYTYELHSRQTGEIINLHDVIYQSHSYIDLIVKKDSNIVDSFEINCNFITLNLDNSWTCDNFGNFFDYINKDETTYTISDEKVKEAYVDGELQANKTINLTDDVTKVDLVLNGEYGLKSTLYIVKTENGNFTNYFSSLTLKHNGKVVQNTSSSEYLITYQIDIEYKGIELSEFDFVANFSAGYSKYSISYVVNGENEIVLKIFDDKNTLIQTRVIQIIYSIRYQWYNNNTDLTWSYIDGQNSFFNSYKEHRVYDNSSPIDLTIERNSRLLFSGANDVATITFDSDENIFVTEDDWSSSPVYRDYNLCFNTLGVHTFTVTVHATDTVTKKTYTFNVTVVESEPLLKVSNGDEYVVFNVKDEARHLFLTSETGAIAMLPINDNFEEFMQGKATLNFDFNDALKLKDAEGQPITSGEHVVDLQPISAAGNSYGIGGLGYRFYVDFSTKFGAEYNNFEFVIVFDYESVIAEITNGEHSVKMAEFDNGISCFDYIDNYLLGKIFILNTQNVEKHVINGQTIYTTCLSITGDNIKVFDMDGELIEDTSDFEITLVEDFEDKCFDLLLMSYTLQIQQGEQEPQTINLIFNDYLYSTLQSRVYVY